MLTQRFDSAARLQRLHNLQAQQWFAQPHGQQLLEAAQPLLEEALAGLFGGYLVHCGPAPAGVLAPRIQRQVCLGPPGTATQIHCEEHAWPLAEHAADVVVLQHSLESELEQALKYESVGLSVARRAVNDAREQAAAFREKRKGVYTGT